MLKVAHGLPEHHPVHEALVEMKSGGRMRLNLYPNEQLGSQVQCLEQAQVGTCLFLGSSVGNSNIARVSRAME